MMSFSRAGDSLSFRLLKLHSYYNQEKHVWDIGCDHGHLGLSFSPLESVETINLVDPSQPVIDVLNQKLIDSYISKAKVFHLKGQDVTISSPSNCIFIAGMGGEEIGEIVSRLLPQLNSSSRIVISPHRKILELRSQLNKASVKLLSEEVIFENDQFYQIMCLSPGNGTPVSTYGESLWVGENGAKYREHQLAHFSMHRDEASKAYVEFLRERNPLKPVLNK
jgi:tRNA (adenine22-N1)-methyltransferase